MAKQTELGHVLPDRPTGRASRVGGFFAPIVPPLPIKRIWPPRFQGNPNKHFDGFHFHPSIHVPSDQTKMATNTHNESSLESDPTDERRTAGRGDGGGQSEIDRPK